MFIAQSTDNFIWVPDDYFLLAVSGWTTQKQVRNTELISLEDSLAACQKWPEYPIPVQSSVSAYINKKTVLVFMLLNSFFVSQSCGRIN